jgi:ABC-2 type transport system permease protein
MFELKKILNRKKALVFLLALNVIPLVASIALMIAYIKFRGFGFGEIQFSVLSEVIQGLFTGHVKLFAFIAPFFLALVVGDSFSTEFSRGYMKMLLIAPVRRWQVISAKTLAIMLFLLLAVFIGGFFLQTDLWLARALTQNSGIVSGTPETIYLVSTSAALQLLFLTFIGNLMLIGFFVVFSMFFESAIVMSFTSLSVLMGVHTFYLIAGNFLSRIDTWYGKASEWCFTRHLDQMFAVSTIEQILEGKVSIFAGTVFASVTGVAGWSAIFFLIALFIFSRKQILH